MRQVEAEIGKRREDGLYAVRWNVTSGGASAVLLWIDGNDLEGKKCIIEEFEFMRWRFVRFCA